MVDTMGIAAGMAFSENEQPMTKPLIIIPARVGSVRVKRKNFRRLPDGSTLIDRAVADARKLKGQIVVTTDHDTWQPPRDVILVDRGSDLSDSDAPMSHVVENVLGIVSGPQSQAVVLLQPTTPYRDLAAIRQMIKDAHPKWAAMTTYATKALDPNHRAWLSYGFVQHVRVITGEAYVFVRGTNRWPSIWHEHDVPLLPLNIDTPAQWKALCRQVRLEMKCRGK